MNNKKHRIFALIMSIIIFVVILAASAFIAGNSHHECINEDCPVCSYIELCENIIRTIGTAVFGKIAVFITGIVLLNETAEKAESVNKLHTLLPF